MTVYTMISIAGGTAASVTVPATGVATAEEVSVFAAGAADVSVVAGVVSTVFPSVDVLPVVPVKAAE